MVQQKLRNELPKIMKLLEPYKANSVDVVEEHLQLVLADRWVADRGFRSGASSHPRSLPDHGRQSENGSPRDAYALAKLLMVGAIPAAYIYPVKTRPVRDLLRRRLHLVQVRAGEYGSLRRLLLRQGILSSKQQEIKTATETELEQWFVMRLHASQELRRIELYSQQIAELEKTILELAQTERSYELLL